MTKWLLALLAVFIVSQTNALAANNQVVTSDYFTSGSLASGWAAALGNSACSITGSAPYYAEPGSTTGSYGQIWTGTTYPRDQISEVTVKTLTAESGTVLTLFTRISGTGASPNGYEAVITNTTLAIYRLDSGTPTQIGSTVTGITVVSGDVWTFEAAGTQLIVYRNATRQTANASSDGTYTAGYPGFQLASSVNVVDAQVSAWRGYNLIQQDGIWTKQGLVFPASASTLPLGISSISQVLYEGNAQILSGNVYKVWLEDNLGANCSYAESTDGINWTYYSRNPVIAAAPVAIWKMGSTYYLYGQTSVSTGNFYSWTSTDGINWSNKTDTGIGLGTSGQWDDTHIWTFQPVRITGTIGSGGTAYALYSAGSNTVPPTITFETGLATSTDMVHWTKYGGNPVCIGYTQQGVINIGGTTYVWFCGTSSAQNDSVYRLQSTDLINWTNKTQSIQRTQMYENVNQSAGQVYMGSLMTVGTNTYMWYNSVQTNGASAYQGSLAIAPIPISQLVTGLEDGTAQIASDDFSYGVGSLSNKWITPTNGKPLQVVSGPYAAPTITTGNIWNCEYYNGASFSADQYSEITIQNLGSSPLGYILPAVRMQPGSVSFYGATMSGIGSGSIQKFVNNVATTLASFAFTKNVGDVVRLKVTGSNPVVLSVYLNGVLQTQYNDFTNAYTSGQPGFGMFGDTGGGTALVSLWAGGNANVIPTYTPSSNNVNFPAAGFSGGNVGFSSAVVGFN